MLKIIIISVIVVLFSIIIYYLFMMNHDHKDKSDLMANNGLLFVSNAAKAHKLCSKVNKIVQRVLYIKFNNGPESSLPIVNREINNIYSQTAQCGYLDVRLILKPREMIQKIKTKYPIDFIMFDSELSNEANSLKQSVENVKEKYQVQCIECEEAVDFSNNVEPVKTYEYVALGGTFDRLHSGHKILLSQAALRATKHVTVGVTDVNMIQSKILWELIEPVETRIKAVYDFLTDINPDLEYNIVPLQDLYGPTKDDPRFQQKGVPLTKEEVMQLVELVDANPVIFSKATNATNNQLKEAAWNTITDQFNALIASIPRKPEQLRLKWENLKKAARKRSTRIRMNNLKLIVVSEETIRGAEKINEKRKQEGLPILDMFVIGLTKDLKKKSAEEETKVSSSNQRMRLLGTLLRPPVPNPNIPDWPYVIGLAGGIASGKSSIAEKLRLKGAAVVNCDIIAHELYKPGLPLNSTIAKEFGKTIITETGEVDRRKLGQIVFSDKEQLEKLNRIVWPAVIEETQRRIRALGQEGYRVVVMEAAVMVRAQWYHYCHQLWSVIIPPAEAIKRLQARNNLSEEEAKQRVEAQPSNLEQVARANVVFSPYWSYEYTSGQIDRAWDHLWEYLNSRNSKI